MFRFAPGKVPAPDTGRPDGLRAIVRERVRSRGRIVAFVFPAHKGAARFHQVIVPAAAHAVVRVEHTVAFDCDVVPGMDCRVILPGTVPRFHYRIVFKKKGQGVCGCTRPGSLTTACTTGNEWKQGLPASPGPHHTGRFCPVFSHHLPISRRRNTGFGRTSLARFFWPIQGSQGCLDVAKMSPVAGALWPVIGHQKRAYFGKPGLNCGYFPREPKRGGLRGFPGRGGTGKGESGADSGVFQIRFFQQQ